VTPRGPLGIWARGSRCDLPERPTGPYREGWRLACGGVYNRSRKGARLATAAVVMILYRDSANQLDSQPIGELSVPIMRKPQTNLEPTPNVAAKAPRDRSPAFPFISLKTALERLVSFQKYFGYHPTPGSKSGLAWGLKEEGSRADQTLAALRSYGLLQYVGMGLLRQVALTDQGRAYLEADQDSVKKQIIRQFALRPKIIRKFWAAWGVGRPPDQVAFEQLCLQYEFSSSGAVKFLQIYDETIIFAGLCSYVLRENNDQANLDPSSPPPAQESVKLVEGERIVFTEEADSQQYVKVIARGEVNESLLDALQDYVRRQKKRIGL
jgi:hypothetical protein